MVKQTSLLEGHKVKDAMLQNITKLHPEDTVKKAIETLLMSSEKDFIVTENNKIVGIVTQKEIIKNKSLNLLNVNALKLHPRVVILNFQKLINKNEVKPTNSHPNINVKKLLPLTKIIIDKINQFKSNINSSARSSYLK